MSGKIRTIRVGLGPGLEFVATGPALELDRCRHADALSPLIDIHEGDDGLILEADIPGANEGSLTVQVDDHVLTLRVQRPAQGSDGARLLHEEFRAGEFARSFILSDEVDRDGISAELRHGVLRLALPRSPRQRPRKIEVNSRP